MRASHEDFSDGISCFGWHRFKVFRTACLNPPCKDKSRYLTGGASAVNLKSVIPNCILYEDESYEEVLIMSAVIGLIIYLINRESAGTASPLDLQPGNGLIQEAPHAPNKFIGLTTKEFSDS